MLLHIYQSLNLHFGAWLYYYSRSNINNNNKNFDSNSITQLYVCRALAKIAFDHIQYIQYTHLLLRALFIALCGQDLAHSIG